ncbi:MAG: hypothetical protein U0105_00105 [Candidatus Obscuribacterales bacterium]
MVLRTVEEQEVSMDELVLEQLVTWVKKLKEVGVSPDKAVEVAQNFMLASMAVACEEEGEDDDFEDDDEN